MQSNPAIVLFKTSVLPSTAFEIAISVVVQLILWVYTRLLFFKCSDNSNHVVCHSKPLLCVLCIVEFNGS